jgi:hypothetical protein
MNTSFRIGGRRYEATTSEASRQAERWRPGQSERLATSGDGVDGFFSRARHQPVPILETLCYHVTDMGHKPCSHFGNSMLARYQYGAPLSCNMGTRVLVS